MQIQIASSGCFIQLRCCQCQQLIIIQAVLCVGVCCATASCFVICGCTCKACNAIFCVHVCTNIDSESFAANVIIGQQAVLTSSVLKARLKSATKQQCSRHDSGNVQKVGQIAMLKRCGLSPMAALPVEALGACVSETGHLVNCGKGCSDVAAAPSCCGSKLAQASSINSSSSSSKCASSATEADGPGPGPGLLPGNAC